jgi:putative membrane protein
MGPVVIPERHFHQGIGTGGWILWILLTIAFWALVITAIIWLVRAIRGRPATGPGPERVHWAGPAGGPGRFPNARYGPFAAASAEQILAERFAHGQIDENEYRARLAVLRSTAGDPYGTPSAPPVPPMPPEPPEPPATPASPEPPTA